MTARTITTAAPCARSGCLTRVQARGLCNLHYKQAARGGSLPPKVTTPGVEERFWSRVERTETCWWWRGTVSCYGYGAFAPGRGRNIRAHKFAWESTNGPVPDGLVLDHLCRNRACCNPEHLEPVTPRVNSLRGIGPSAINSRKTECVNGHRFTPANTRVDADGRRNCRTCARAKAARSNAVRRAERDATRCVGVGRCGPCQRTTTHPSVTCHSHRRSTR